MYGPRPIRFSAHWCADYSKYWGFLAGGISPRPYSLFMEHGSAAKTLISHPHNTASYAGYKYNRTCQRSIKKISIEKTFALRIFFFKEIPWWALLNRLKIENFEKRWFFFTLDDTLKIFYPWNQLLIMLFVRLHNLFCSFQKSTALHLGIGPLLMLHLFYGTRCH